MTSLNIPAGPEEITPEWLTLALRETGIITNATVSSVSLDTTVVSHGFAGQIVRVGVTYNFSEQGAPSSLIAKFPPSYPQTRALLHRSDRLGREIRFYQEIAADVGLPTPQCYYGAMNVEAGRYLLLLEDLAPALVGDQVAGCSFEDSDLAIRHLAKLHATWWESPELDGLDWAPLWNVNGHMVEATYSQSWHSFLELLGDRLTPSLIDIGERLGRDPNYVRNQLAKPPRTLVHGDYRLDNLFFATDEGTAPITAVDWDICRRGRGVYDAAYFITGSLHPEQRKREEIDLLRSYHSVLVENGISGYSFEQCRYDYRLAMLDVLLFFVQALPAFNFESERGQAHLDLLFQRQFTAITDLNCGELLPT